MKFRRVTALLLSMIILCASCAVCAFGAQDSWQAKNEQPFVFVHGLNGWGGAEGINGVMPYWGATTGDLMSYLQQEGYDCFSASVGPLSSAWDRACELYAQLIGGTVDYGAAHSAKFNHSRYGRTYYHALIPNWGELDENGKLQQIHLIGHSFGGATIRVMVELLTNGSAEEKAATDESELSGLFTGGKGNWVKSVTTICTPHNSASIYYPLKALNLDTVFYLVSYAYAGIAGRSYVNGKLVDFHLEQFGLTDVPNGKKADNFFKAMACIMKNREDSCIQDLTPEGCSALNEKLDINENIYYFSYPFSTTEELEPLGIQVPIKSTNPVIWLTSVVMGILRFKDPVLGTDYEGDWLANDALVNTESAKYPLDEPHQDFDADNITKGVWNVMPVQQGDHGTAIGLFADEETTHNFYLELCEMLNELP